MIHTRKEDSEMMNMTSIRLKPLAEVVAMVEPKVEEEEVEDMEEAEEAEEAMVALRVVDPRTRKWRNNTNQLLLMEAEEAEDMVEDNNRKVAMEAAADMNNNQR